MNIDDLSPQEKRALLEKQLRRRIQSGVLDLEAEARLDLTVHGEAVDQDKEPQAIFLTGATGFVGAFTLKELLDGTSARIYCLARAQDGEDGRKRIKANLDSYGLEYPELDSRVVAVPGDLTKPHFGLPPDEFTLLGRKLDVIYHIAASVNLAHTYQQVKPANVGGTREVIKLAAAERVKPLHYLSSYAVFDSIHNVDRVFSEQDEPVRYEGLSNGYAQGKWVAEKMVRNSRAAGIPARIYRVGWVVGHSRTGAWNQSDFIPRFIKACLEMRSYCDLGSMTMTPVDYVAKALVNLSRQTQATGSIFHLSNGRRYATPELFQWVRSFGYELDSVSLEDWEKEIRRSRREISLAPLLLFLEGVAGGMAGFSRWLSHEPNVDVAYSLRELAPSGIACPAIDEKMMALYLSYFISKGFISKPD